MYFVDGAAHIIHRNVNSVSAFIGLVYCSMVYVREVNVLCRPMFLGLQQLVFKDDNIS